MKRSIKTLIVLILFFNTILMYFFDSSYDMLGIIDFEDFLSLFNLFSALLLVLMTKNYKSAKYGFKKWIFIFIILCFISSLQSYSLYGQSIFSGLGAQKELICAALLYFPLSKIVANDLIDTKRLSKMIDIFAIIQLVLFITQYLLSNSFTFLMVHTAERYGEIRYYFNPILLDIFLIKNLNELLNNKGKKTKNLIFISLILFETMLVQKFRLTSIALIIVIVLGLLISKTNFIKKFSYLITASVFSTFMLNTRIVQDLISEFTTKQKTFTYSVRRIGRKHYLNALSQHPVVGCGFPVSDVARSAAGYDQRIILGDNGIFGFAYVYGALGILWFSTLWLKLIKNGHKIFKATNDLFYLLVPMFFAITCINEIHWYWQSGFIVFIFFILLMENKIKQVGDYNE